MNREAAIEAVMNLQKQAIAMELLIEEGDQHSVAEARGLLTGAKVALVNLADELQASTAEGMSSMDVQYALEGYADGVKVQVCVFEIGEGAPRDKYGFYTIESITDLDGTSPTVPVIKLGKCIAKTDA